MGTPDGVINRWGGDTYRHLAALATSAAAPDAGVFPVTCHAVFREAVPELPSWRHIVNNFRTLDSAALARMGQAGAAGGFAFESLIADQSRYLPWLQAQLRAAGGAEYRTQHLASLHDLAGSGYQAVLNCSGAPACFVARTCFVIAQLYSFLHELPWMQAWARARLQATRTACPSVARCAACARRG